MIRKQGVQKDLEFSEALQHCLIILKYSSMINSNHCYSISAFWCWQHLHTSISSPLLPTTTWDLSAVSSIVAQGLCGALDHPFDFFVVRDRVKSSVEVYQEIQKRHKEYRNKHLQTLHMSKDALNIIYLLEKNNEKNYLDFNVSHFSCWSYNRSSNQSWKYVLRKIGACIATFHKLKRRNDLIRALITFFY